MRKKTKVRRAIKVLSCDGLIVKYFAMITVALLVVASTGCASKRDSWEMYCEKYNVNPDDPTEHEENFYLDCYVGSVEEENDLCN